MCMSAQQNLVPNGSFEDYTVCPNNVAQVDYANHWFDPTYTSSDYFNACCSNGIVGVPNNFYGNKSSYDGNGMMGFAMYSGITYPNSREYIGVKLLQNLDSNVNYCFSCYISLAKNWKYACNGFGFYLTTDTTNIYNFSYSTIGNTATFIENKIIYDSLGWTNINTSFVNNIKNAKYLILGNFFDDSIITKSIVNINALDISYYYIDNVELISCEKINIPNVFTPNNDGVNDTFIIKNLPFNSNLSIYNRWGNLIYRNNNYQNDWKPIDEVAGTYYYILQTETENYKGFLEIFK